MFPANRGTLGAVTDGARVEGNPPGSGDEGDGTQVFRWQATLG